MRNPNLLRLPLAASLAALVALVVLSVGIAGAANQRTLANVDMRGVWDAPSYASGATYPQQWHIAAENLTTGAFTGTDVGGGATFTIVGQAAGNHITATISEPGYTSHGQATISGNSGSGTFTDTNGTSGTFTLRRLSGPPGGGTTPPPNPNQDATCVGSCSQDADVTYDPSLEPGQTTDDASVSCSSGRTTASAFVASGLLCGIEADVQALTQGVTSPTLAADMLKGLQDISNQSPDANTAAMQNVLQQMQDAQQSAQQVQQQQQQLQQMLQDVLKNMQSSNLQSADTTLAGDFPTGSDAVTAFTENVRGSALALGTPSSALVIQSIAADHPSAAAGAAFKAEVKLATAATYSPQRAQARITLAVAYIAGRKALAVETKGLGSKITIAHTSTNVQPHHKKGLTIRATPLGARVLRLLSLKGLSHKVSIQLKLSSTRAGKTSHATRTLSVR
jgi:hypothetical protein